MSWYTLSKAYLWNMVQNENNNKKCPNFKIISYSEKKVATKSENQG